jgi:hypothetical protein
MLPATSGGSTCAENVLRKFAEIVMHPRIRTLL